MTSVRITVLGDHNDAYATHRELDAALARLGPGVAAGWVASDAPRAAGLGARGSVDGLWIAPGGPYRDNAAVLAAIGRARRDGVPPLGGAAGFRFRRWRWGPRWAAGRGPAPPKSGPGPQGRSSRRLAAPAAGGG